jgi:hypothetical protein
LAHRDLLHATAGHAADFLDSLGERPIFPRATAEEFWMRLGGPLPESPIDPATVVEELAAAARLCILWELKEVYEAARLAKIEAARAAARDSRGKRGIMAF